MLGTIIHRALSIAGVTPERVEEWVGAPCGCRDRSQKLDQLTYWALMVARGRLDQARKYLERIMGD